MSSQFRALSDEEYIVAASLLDTILSKNTAKCSTSMLTKPSDAAKSLSRSAPVVNLVYATSKCTTTLTFTFNSLLPLDLEFLEQILIRTEFLVQNHELIQHLSLLKVILFQFMACHFELEPLARGPADSSFLHDPTVRMAMQAVDSQKVKLHAAYARLRIETGAAGGNDEERLANMVDWSSQQLVEDAPALFRLRCTKAEFDAFVMAKQPDGLQWPPSVAQQDKTFQMHISVPQCYASELIECKLYNERHVVLQDRASALVCHLICEQLLPSTPGSRPCVLDARITSGARYIEFFQLH